MTTGRTGEECQQSGIYDSNCHTKQLALSKGATFPPCRCRQAVIWILVPASSGAARREILLECANGISGLAKAASNS